MHVQAAIAAAAEFHGIKGGLMHVLSVFLGFLYRTV